MYLSPAVFAAAAAAEAAAAVESMAAAAADPKMDLMEAADGGGGDSDVVVTNNDSASLLELEEVLFFLLLKDVSAPKIVICLMCEKVASAAAVTSFRSLAKLVLIACVHFARKYNHSIKKFIAKGKNLCAEVL